MLKIIRIRRVSILIHKNIRICVIIQIQLYEYLYFGIPNIITCICVRVCKIDEILIHLYKYVY